MNFEKLEDCLLRRLDERVLTREEALGKTLKKDVPALTPITPDVLEGYKEEVSMVEVPKATTNVTGGFSRLE